MRPLPKVDWYKQLHLKYHQREFCSATVQPMPGYNYIRKRGCRRHASFLVNGSKLCELHAGRALILLLIEGSIATSETPNAKET